MTDTPRVRLRDVTLADADLLDAWNRDEGSEFNDFGEEPKPLPMPVSRRFKSSTRMGKRSLPFGVPD